MRRLLLTARSLVAFVMGNPAVVASGAFGAARVLVDSQTATRATGSGVLDTANFYATTAGNIYVMTGVYLGGTYTVRDISTVKAVVVGANAITGLALAVVAGDSIGVYMPSTGGAVAAFSFSGAGMANNTTTPATVPTPGAVLSLSNQAGQRLSMNGSGAG